MNERLPVIARRGARTALCGRGGIGRRKGLKIPWGETPCRFELRPPAPQNQWVSSNTGRCSRIAFSSCPHCVHKIKARRVCGGLPARRLALARLFGTLAFLTLSAGGDFMVRLLTATGLLFAVTLGPTFGNTCSEEAAAAARKIGATLGRASAGDMVAMQLRGTSEATYGCRAPGSGRIPRNVCSTVCLGKRFHRNRRSSWSGSNERRHQSLQISAQKCLEGAKADRTGFARRRAQPFESRSYPPWHPPNTSAQRFAGSGCRRSLEPDQLLRRFL